LTTETLISWGTLVKMPLWAGEKMNNKKEEQEAGSEIPDYVRDFVEEMNNKTEDLVEAVFYMMGYICDEKYWVQAKDDVNSLNRCNTNGVHRLQKMVYEYYELDQP